MFVGARFAFSPYGAIPCPERRNGTPHIGMD